MPNHNLQPPAGYFSTFSVLDPNNITEGQAKVQKRNRRVFVCIPCHNRKLKCDKGHPCGRCKSTGNASECVYQAFPKSSSPSLGASGRARGSRSPSQEEARPRSKSPQVPQIPQVPQQPCNKPRIHGATHWANVASLLKDSELYLNGGDPQWQPRLRQLKDLKYLLPQTGGTNFPFGNLGSFTLSTHQIVEALPAKHIVEGLVAHYLETFEVTHRLLHPPQFQEELASFWQARDRVSDEWLAQLCMMLALASETAPTYLFDGSGQSGPQLAHVLLDWAQMGLTRSIHLAVPSLTTVRTLAMMILAMLMDMRSGSCAQVMGLLSRISTELQLHRSAVIFPNMGFFESEMRRRVWATVQLLDLDVAMRTGTSSLCFEHDAEPPANVNEGSVLRDGSGLWSVDSSWISVQSEDYTDGTFQIVLSEILPLLAEVINIVNAPTKPCPEYAKVCLLDTKIRQKLEDIRTRFFGSALPHLQSARAHLQHQLLEIITHRTLLALHQSHITPAHPLFDEKSQADHLASALLVLGIQQSWGLPGCPSISSEVPSLGASARSSPTVCVVDLASPKTWLLDLCHDDFGAALMHACIVVSDPRFDINGSNRPYSIDTAVHQSLCVMREKACRSIPQFKEYLGVSILVTVLQARKWGMPVVPALMATADDIEQLILMGTQEVWTQDASAVAAAAAAATTTMGYPPPLQNVPFLAIDSELLGSYA